MTEKTKLFILRNVPEKVHAKLKAQAALEGKTLQKLILEILEQYLKK